MATPSKIQTKTPTGRILYFTDKYGVSEGYDPAFTKMVMKAGIPRKNIIIANIYGLVSNPLIKYRNENTPRFNPERKTDIEAAVRQRINMVKPVLIVCSDPVSLGLFTGWDIRVSTLDKTRGGLYNYMGIPVLVTIPVTAIHRNVAESYSKDDDGEEVKYEPYKVPQGAWILAQDWAKISRFYHGKQRKLPPFQYSVCRTTQDCYAARDWLLGCVLIADDIETALYPAQITCIGYTGIRPDGKVRTFVIPFYDPTQEDGCFWATETEHIEAFLCCRDINESPVLKVQQNGNYDSSYFVRDNLGLNNWLLDTMLMWYSLYMELPKSLDFISSVLLDVYQYWKDDIKGADEKDEITQFGLERYWRYNGLDTYYTLFNCLYMLRLLGNNKAMQINYRDVWMRAESALKMSMRGVKADKQRLTEHRKVLIEEYESAVGRLRYMIADPDFNVNSPDQKKSLLYDVLGARPRNNKGRFLTKDATASSGAIALKAIKSEHPLFKMVIDALEDSMEPDKQMGLITGREQPDGSIKGGIKFFTDRFRTCYSAAGTTSTRFSSKSSNFWDGTNAQNIRASMRDFLVADPGCILMDVDYSQSDDVFMGYESNDRHKIEVIESGVDGHAVHGELFFKMPYDEIVAGKRAGDPRIIHPIYGVRQLSKRIVHGCLLPDAEVLTRDGWKRIAEFQEDEEAMTWNPNGVMEWQPAGLYCAPHEGEMVHFESQSAELTMTPDHNMWTAEYGRGKARSNYRKRVTIPTAGNYEGGKIYPAMTRLQVALMADGSLEPSGMWRASFKKPRKIHRFKQLCEEAGVRWDGEYQDSGYYRFHVWPNNKLKHWSMALLACPLDLRRELIEEVGHWDGDFHGNGIRFFTADKSQADAFMALATCSGYSAGLTKTTANEDSYNPGGIMWVVGLTRKLTRGIRKERWSIQDYQGNVYCLLVPNQYFLVRQNGRVSITGNTNFQMAAITLFMTMGKDAVVAAMRLMGADKPELWTTDQLINGCQILMNAYRKKYPRLTPKEYYKDISDMLRTKGSITNAFGITRKFLGDWKDSGTQREATGFIGQSDTAGNMNRSMYEIDHGFIPERFRDGDNPDRNDTPRRMGLESHGFRFLLQTHDSFTAQLNLDHPRFEEAAHNLLHVMERPVIINGHTVRVRTEASFGLRWGKKMVEWNPQKSSLNDIVTQALAA